MSLFEEISSTDQYQKLLKRIPQDEQGVIAESLRMFVEHFETNVLVPLEKTVEQKTSANEK